MSELGDKLESLRIEREEEAPPRSNRWLVAAAVALVAAIVLWFFWPRSPEPLQVTTAAAVEASADGGGTVLNATGYVTARLQATVSSKITGKVVEVLIEEGTEVAAGEVLARLDDANARAALELSRAELRSARAALAETRVLRDEADLELDRARSLVAARVASQAELDRAEARHAALEARLASQGETVSVAERRLALDRQLVDDLVIRAPFAGMVVSKNAQPGEMISPISAGGGFTRTGIGTLVDMDSLEIEVDVNEAYIQRVESGQPVEAVLDAYPDWTIPAHVIAIVPTADRQKATVRVRIGFDSPGDSRVLPDMGVKVAFRAAEAAGGRPGVTVPAGAIRTEGEAKVVFVARDGAVERRAVTLGASERGTARVVAGVAPGERVVVDPPAELADGRTIEEEDERR